MSTDLAAAISAVLAWYDLIIGVPCLLRSYNMLTRQDAVANLVSDTRQRGNIRGMFFIAWFTVHFGLWRAWAAWSFKLEFWGSNQATLFWAFLIVNGIGSALGVLHWGLVTVGADTDDGRQTAMRRWWLVVLLGPLLGIVVYML